MPTHKPVSSATARVSTLVRTQTRALLERSPAFPPLDEAPRRALAQNMARIARFLVDGDGITRDVPVRVELTREGRDHAVVLSNSVAFPEFVAELIGGVFDAIVDTSIAQMKAYARLLAHVAQSVDTFMEDGASDAASTHLAQTWPECFAIERKTKRLRMRPDCSRSATVTRTIADDLGIQEGHRASVARLTLAAKQHVVLQRQQQVARALLMGINRIVVTDGRTGANVRFTRVARSTHPGVHVEEVGVVPRIEAVTLSVAGFVGVTPFAPSRAGATLVTSYIEYANVFGGEIETPALSASRSLPRAVAGFFANGGTRAYVSALSAQTPPSDQDVLGQDDGHGGFTGLLALQHTDEIGLIAAPGVTSLVVQRAMIEQCERGRNRFAILDAPLQATLHELEQRRQRLVSSYAAVYVPWLTASDGAQIPPSGHVAGILARSERLRGIWAAPANRPVVDITGVTEAISNRQQEQLTQIGVNAVRFLTGRGVVLWGARTTSTDPEWKYVSLRRYFTFLERSIDGGLRWAAFEPNDEALWLKARASVEWFLFDQWRSGALMGVKPEEAYFVRCDRTTMTQNDLDNGRLVVLVGVAPVRPAEFVIFRIGVTTTA